MRIPWRVIVLLPLLVSAVGPMWTISAAPLKGHSKALISHPLGQSRADVVASIIGKGSQVLGDYDSFTLVSVPQAEIDHVRGRAAAARVGVTIHDEYDLIGLPGGNVDSRDGLTTPPGADSLPPYSSGKYGLFILQFIGPPQT